MISRIMTAAVFGLALCACSGGADDQRQLACEKLCDCIETFASNATLERCPGRCVDRIDRAPDLERCIEGLVELPADPEGCALEAERLSESCGTRISGYCFEIEQPDIVVECD